MVLSDSKHWQLIGLSSFGDGCANPNYGSGYTLIAPFVQFIQTHIDRTTTHSIATKCICQCPRRTDSGYAYTTANSLHGCVKACQAVSLNSCNSSNTFVCLGTSCAYTSMYNHTCSCQCPRGINAGYTYTTQYSASSCVRACRAVPSNICSLTNTYACVDDECAYSDLYTSTTTTPAPRYTCKCECPRGIDSGYAYSTVNSLHGCVEACRAVPTNPCNRLNTFVCLGTSCAYTDTYNHTCSCQCPRGMNSGYAYTTEFSSSSCVRACRDVSSNRCTNANTYACADNQCAYSTSYTFTTTTPAPRYTCTCECPHRTVTGYAYSAIKSLKGCVQACQAMPTNPCTSSNTFVCLGRKCGFASSYNRTCTCQCPRGMYVGYAYTTQYSASSCVSACQTLSSNLCTSSNTYACVYHKCAYSDSYTFITTTPAPRYICKCECPRGVDSGYAYSIVNSLHGCVEACQAVPTNPCNRLNTFVCLGTSCAYTSTYNHTCSCQCPRGMDVGYAYTTEYSATSCVSACQAVSLNLCTSSNTYACVDNECAYSD